jgi:hypothetical protein
MARRRRRTIIDLFPFLSLMLCIVGVLAFIQVVLASIGDQSVDMEGTQSQLRAYQIFCGRDGITLLKAPIEPAAALQERLTGEAAAQVRAIVEERRKRPTGWRPLSDAEIATLLTEIHFLNATAQEHGLAYEEFLSFGIYAGGADTYHRVRQAAYRVPYNGIKVGIAPLLQLWQPAGEHPGAPGEGEEGP